MECVEQFYGQSSPIQVDENELWNAMLTLCSQLKQAIRSLENGVDHKLIGQLVPNNFEENDRMIWKCIRQFLPKNGRLRVYKDLIWVRFNRNGLSALESFNQDEVKG